MNDKAQLKVRFSRSMLEELRSSATGHNRSLNAEVVSRLEKSLREEELIDRIRDVVREEIS